VGGKKNKDDHMQKWVLGIDGGGTKTAAILVAEDGTFGAQQTVGPTSLTTVGVTQAAQIIFDLAMECCRKVSCTSEQLTAVGIGLAGAGRVEMRDEFQRVLERLSREKNFPFPRIVVDADWRVALEAAFPTSPGIVLIAGTGSVACMRAEDGSIHRVGGWGRIFGDEGSAYALGRDGLKAVLRAHDGRGEETLLLQLALEHFDVPKIGRLMDKIYRENADIASFASKVFLANNRHDHVAHQLLISGAGELAQLVRTLVTNIPPKRKMPVAFMGGLMSDDTVYAKLVREFLFITLPQLVMQRPKFPAAYGAAILAFQPFSHTR
jgi:N-acetylglucosamine kinase-like BadF-type ATPase